MMGIKFEVPQGAYALPSAYDYVAAWHNTGLPKAPGTPIEILARYLPKEKRWLVLVDGDEPFVCESASLAKAMEKAGTIIEADS